MLLPERNSPRWLVYLTDIIICFGSIIIAYLLRFNFSIPPEFVESLRFVIPLVLLIRGGLFLIGRTYSGIVRYTSVKDAQRIIVVNLIGTLIFVVINIIDYKFIRTRNTIPYSIVIIEFITTVSAMTAVRLIVKMLAAEFNIPNRDRSQVVVFGTNELSVITKRSLEMDKANNYKVVAFLDSETKNKNKKIEGISIFHPNSFEEIIKKFKLTNIVFADQNISPKLKNKITDICLHEKIEVLTVPALNSWINGELSVNQIKNIKIEDLLGRESIKLDIKKLQKELGGKVILVTGGAGSIGSELACQVTHYKPKQLIIVDQAETDLYDIEIELEEKQNFKNFEVVIGDVTDHVRMKRIFDHFKPEIIFHAAAYKHVPMMENNPAEAIQNNVTGTRVIADLAVDFKVEKFVMISTDKAVNPTNVMGASKRLAEIYIQSLDATCKTNFVTTRFGNVLGSNGSVIPRFRKQIETGGPITVTHPEITRYFMTIPEACRLVLEASVMGKGGEIFLFDMGKSVKIVDLAKKMIKLSGLELGKDIQIKFTGLRPGEKLFEELLANSENTKETHHPQIMIAKVKKHDFKKIVKKLDNFPKAIEEQNNLKLVEIMKKIIPEFISKNSIYEKLDK